MARTPPQGLGASGRVGGEGGGLRGGQAIPDTEDSLALFCDFLVIL